MGAKSAWLGLDLGTSAVKAVLCDSSGATHAAARVALVLDMPEPLAAEQDPQAWWSAAVQAIRACLGAAPGRRVEGVGLTGQKHALLALDGEGRPLAPAVLWCDGRAAEASREAVARVPDLGARTGAPALPGYLVAKWLRFLAVDEARARRTRYLCFAKDWLRFGLTGTLATDATEASASQLWEQEAWSPSLCQAFEVPVAALPEVRPSMEVTGKVTAEAAAATGLARGTPVVAGAGDNEAGAIACGALTPGVLAVMLGTSGTVVARAGTYGPVGGLVWGRHALRFGSSATGTVLSFGRALDWYARIAYGGDVEALVRAAQGADGAPLFLPTLVGERSPVPDPDARGAFADLAPHHEASHLAQAVLEGTALSVGAVVHAMRDAGVPVEVLRLTSGAAAAVPVRSLVAAAANAPAAAVGGEGGPATGAACLARHAGASDEDLEAASAAWARAEEAETPLPSEVDRLAVLAARLERLRKALQTP